ncbi:shikimate dehydrogenase [Rhodococcus triatomae]|nr:shikimate 5-dehydrogenase [Rhodococcus triatomae BKS 15-14]
MAGESVPRRAAVLGKPIDHSRSPDLHLAAYRALGLTDWTYDRIECTAEELPGLVDGLGPEWIGLSVTMPGKVAALTHAVERTERAVQVGSANTLVRIDEGAGGWRADCTDVDGVVGALAEVGVTDLSGAAVVVVGAGGTSRPALRAFADLGAVEVTVVARSADRAADTLACAATIGLRARHQGLDAAEVGAVCGEAAVVMSTIPASAAADLAPSIARAPVVFDAIYDPWPTPLAAAVAAAGGTVVDGLRMLLNQAFGQVEQFTGMPAPREAMAAAVQRP